MKTILKLFLVGILCAVPATSVKGQNFSSAAEVRSNLTSFYYHSLPGEATVEAYVWGTVRYPGVYEVGAETDLGKLLSFAGGPQLNPRENSDRRQTFVRLFRGQGNQRSLIFEAELDRMVGENQVYPVIMNDDLIVVEIVEYERFNWRDAFTIMGSLAALALAIERTARVAR